MNQGIQEGEARWENVLLLEIGFLVVTNYM